MRTCIMNPIFAGFAVLASLATAAWAGTNGTEQLITVTARGWPAPVSATPGGVGVVDRQRLTEAAPANTATAVATVPGVAAGGDTAWSPDVNIRGLTRNSVVMLIDGARVNTASDLSARFGLLDPLTVERIEVLKGPISSLYGSGSLGGVVNVITRKGRFASQPEGHAGASLTAGSNPDGWGGVGTLTVNRPDVWAFAAQTWRDYDSYRGGNGDTVRNSQFQDAETLLRTGWRVNSAHTVEFNLQHFEGHDIGVPGSGTAPLPAAADVTYHLASRDLISMVNRFTPGGVWKESTLDFYGQYVQRDVVIDHFPATSPLSAVYPQGKHQTIGTRWLNTFEIGSHTLVAGLDAWQRELETQRERVLKTGKVLQDTPLPDSTYGSAGAFVEDDWRIGPAVTLNGGGRADLIHVDNEATALWEQDDRAETSWDCHLGAAWRLSDRIDLKAIAASGYRAATLEERFQYLELGNGTVKYGNPELDPERSLFLECSANWSGSDLVCSLSAFANRLEHMIGERFVDAATIVNANIDEAEIHGLEAEGHYDLAAACSVYGTVAWIDGRNTVTDEHLPDVPPVRGRAGFRLGRDAGPWFAAETVIAAEQDDVPAGFHAADGWTRVDLHGGWNYAADRVRHRVQVNVGNVFDADYRDYLSTYRSAAFSEPGRSVSVSYSVEY